MPRPAGFTVIELVLALVATSVVAALFASAVRTHSIRRQVASGIALASRWQTIVEMSFRSAGRVPRTWEDSGIGRQHISSIFVAEIQLVDGRLDIVYGNEAATAIAGRRLSLTPYETASQELVWVCGNDIPGPGLNPLGFASGGLQSVQAAATVAVRYLPATCR